VSNHTNVNVLSAPAKRDCQIGLKKTKIQVYNCNPSYSGGRGSGGLWFRASLGKLFARPNLKRTGGVAQVVGACLAS
jgi:hypothetical protein